MNIEGRFNDSREVEKEEIYRKLQDDLDDWSNEIPNEIVHMGNYKVRKNWWAGVCADLQVALGLGVSKDIEAEINAFITSYNNPEFTARPTTAEDIGYANNVLRRVLVGLKSTGGANDQERD